MCDIARAPPPPTARPSPARARHPPPPRRRPFARRFASMALSRRPPALYLDGRLSRASYLSGAFTPRVVLDALAAYVFGCWKLHAPRS